MTSGGNDRTGTAFRGTPLCPGVAVGPPLCLEEPLSFWGGVDAQGRVVDVHHPQHGAGLAGAVLVMRSGRGSSSSAAVLAEQIRAGAAPAAIVLAEADSILVAGTLVAAELYDVQVPVLTLTPRVYDRLAAAAASPRASALTARVDVDDRSATVTLGGAR
ncbi:MAG TPA: DUF126 domain-containing protein [Marmoricola sp.]|nr:DUF126 domain-containing protein [Marmoricola sp.]